MRALVIGFIAVTLYAGAAIAYPIDVDLRTEGLDVEAIPRQLDQATVVQLLNHEAFPVRCDVRFTNGPEISRVRKVTVEPGQRHLARFLPGRQVIRLQIDVRCWPSEAAGESP